MTISPPKLNVLIDDDERAVLTDFGLSIILGGFTNLSVTYSDAKSGGALAWAAPELFLDPPADGQGPNPSTSSDVYSFACLMYLVRDLPLVLLWFSFSLDFYWIGTEHYLLCKGWLQAF
jgi:serine/threonine protein kinase